MTLECDLSGREQEISALKEALSDLEGDLCNRKWVRELLEWGELGSGLKQVWGKLADIVLSGSRSGLEIGLKAGCCDADKGIRNQPVTSMYPPR